MYLDANNFYGWIMSQYLLYSKFKSLNQKEDDKFDVNLIKENRFRSWSWISWWIIWTA